MRVKRYLYAGLDFIFDKKRRPFFLEANRSAQALHEYKIHNGVCMPAIILAEFINSKCGELAILVKKWERRFDPSISENVLTAYEEIKKYLESSVNSRFCYVNDNRRKRSSMIDKKNCVFQPDVILRWDHNFNNFFELKGIPVINSEIVSKLVRNKMRTYEIVKKSGARIPKTFLVKNNKENEVVIGSNFPNRNFVIKPLEGTYGKGVVIGKKVRIKKPRIVQERIVPNLINGNYWDVRVYVVNGNYVGGILRYNNNPVTNVHRGGKTMKMPMWVFRKLKRPSLKVVKVVERESEKIISEMKYGR